MAIVIDVIIVATFLFFVIKYGVKGFIQAIIGVGKLIGAVLAAIFLSKPLAIWISDNFISDALSNVVYNKFSENIIDGASLSGLFNNIPEWLSELVKLFDVDIAALQAKYGSEEAGAEVIRDMANTMSGPIADMISSIIAYIFVFLVVLLLLTIIAKILSKIKIPIITGIDKFIGLCLGVVLGVCSVSMIATTVYGILEFFAALNHNPEIMNIYNDSYVFKFVYEIKIFEFIREII